MISKIFKEFYNSSIALKKMKSRKESEEQMQNLTREEALELLKELYNENDALL